MLKNIFGSKYKILYIVIFLILILIVIIGILVFYINKNKKSTEEWVDISEFSNTLEIKKEGNLLSYPEVDILSEVDGEVMMLNVEEGDMVEEWDILMQIGNEELNEDTIDSVERQIGGKYAEFYENMDEYNEFEMQYGEEITTLEENLINDDAILKMAIDMDDKDTISIMEREIQEINEELVFLKRQRDNLKGRMVNLEDEIQSANKESIDLYQEFDKQIPRSTIQGIVGSIYVEEGDEVNNGDKLCTIINNNYIPEISVGLDFNEYVLTQNLTGVMIITENDNRGDSYYEGEIYTRSPVLNEDGKYTITVRIIEEDIPSLILNDKNTKITVIFTRDFSSIWIPESCFTELGNTGGILTLRDGDIITGKDVGIENRWENWINVDNLALFGLEKDEEKDGTLLCIEDWNKGVIKENDVDIINWYNQFNSVEVFCEEYVKVNPMYGTGRRNAAVVSLLGGSGEKIEVLCKLE